MLRWARGCATGSQDPRLPDARPPEESPAAVDAGIREGDITSV